MRRAGWAVLLVSLAGLAGSAQAKCAPPRAFVTPGPGAVLPPNPVLYAFFPSALQRETFLASKVIVVDGQQRPLPAKAVTVTTDGLYQVVQVSLTAPAGTTFGLTDKGLAAASARWTVSAEASPRASSLTLEAVADQRSSWTCSFTSFRVFRASFDAPAWRLEFAPSEAELRASHGRMVVLEGTPEPAPDAGAPTSAPRGLVKLGHKNCAGWTFDWPAATLAVRFTALTADGREVPSSQVFTVDRPPDWQDLHER